MNRNTLDACREIGDAEKLMSNNDYISARDKLLKAQKVLPSLNVGSMLALCDILSAASVKIPNCGIDYYWVLQLMPSSTYSDISCRYRKLLSLLQPIKPRFAATELALKLVREAFFVLSDHNKRSAYDLKRSSVWKDYGSFDVQVLFSNGVKNKESFSDQNSSGLKTVSSSHSSGGSTCENPSTQIEHSKGKTGFSGNYRKSRKRLEQDYYNFENNRQAEIFEAAQVWAAHHQTNGIQNYRYARIDTNLKSAVSVTWLKPVPLTADERRWCDAGLPVACGSFELDPDMTEISSPMAFSHNCLWIRGSTEEQFEVYPKRGEVWALYKDWDLDQWVLSPEKVRGNRWMLVEIISDYSKYIGGDAAYLEKVNGFRCVFQRQTSEGNPIIFHIPPCNLYIFSHIIPAYRFMGDEIDGVADGFFELDQMALTKESPKEGNFGFNPRSKQVSVFKSLRESKYMKPSLMADDFSIGQIWAVYCGKDLMPRRYAHINDVISDSELCVSFLDSQPILDYEISWKKEDLPIVCGIFKIGGNSFNIDISQFSHSVKCQRSTTKPFFKIYPLKGEIWAMYDNWSNNWKKSDSESYECQVVEILSDLSEGNEMVIGRLGEVKGCLTFFDRKTYGGFHLTREIVKQEMLCFSHRIPAFRVPGIGSYGIPESCWHLEPNALPPTSGN